ncbi:Squamosa promoter-binding-like protein 4 [Citrus sinensis]|uniref:SBP-type domain-containing protein n=1 Tax=Citrus clementina TaxID=85681 RepID=V4W3D8_CITCL|nr:hypothetical protein CICLE_v10016841mg [Citrus x clementina]KAH9743929.1 Squamosa promoter-binding-like protein 4 [Citrus sinensis]
MDAKRKNKMVKVLKKEEATAAFVDSDDDDDGGEYDLCPQEEGDDNRNSGSKKKKGSSGGSGLRSCQVDKCAADLSDAKQYHRRHKVCEVHAKAQVVLMGGMRQRFCQQCSRRLAGHNERRRKNAAESNGEGSSCKGTGTGTQLKDLVCGKLDDKGRIKISIQENATCKHFQIR